MAEPQVDKPQEVVTKAGEDEKPIVVAVSAKDAPVVGRTLYDFGAELVQVLGRLTPLFVLVAMFVYSLIEVTRNYQAAQVAASDRYAKSVETLNGLLTNSFGELEKVRKSQLENLEKITALGGTVTDAISKSQDTANKAREQVFEAEKTSQAAAFALQNAKREQQQLQDANMDLKRQAWAAENVIDVAQRLVAFLTENRDLERDKRYLARRYESVNVGGMTRDRDGNTYFGLYRVPGRDMKRLIDFLAGNYPVFEVRLQAVGGQDAAVKGEDGFVQEWSSMSQDPSFAAAQDQFIEDVYYRRFLTQLARVLVKPSSSTGFDPSTHSVALQAVLWSVAVQNGANTPVVRRAFDGIDLSKAHDAVLIKAIYAERRKTAVYFPGESDLSQKLLAIRYKFEEQEALKMLETTGQDAPQAGEGK